MKRAQVIENLQYIVDLYNQFKEAGNEVVNVPIDSTDIKVIKFAIESIKVDLEYDLLYEGATIDGEELE